MPGVRADVDVDSSLTKASWKAWRPESDMASYTLNSLNSLNLKGPKLKALKFLKPSPG